MTGQAAPSRSLQAAALLASAASGGAVLSLELWSAARLAPAFGSGLDVWSAVLSVTFGALAVGYLVGSFRTRHWATWGHAAAVLAASALAVLGSSSLGGSWLDAVARDASAGSLLTATVLLLAVPVTLLAILGPWLVERHHRHSGGRAAGRSAGLLYAASTLGGVVCALTTGFYAVPAWGLSRTALAIAALLAGAALVLMLAAWQARRGSTAPALLVLGLAGALTLVTPVPGAVAGRHVLAVRTSMRGLLVVTDDGLHRTLWANGIPQTRAASRDLLPLLTPGLLAQGNAMGVLPYLRPKPGRALVVGLGGGTVAHALSEYGWDVEAVEIDPQVVALAREHFGYEGACSVMDGRRFLRTRSQRYDLVVVDVYRGEDLPPHLVTREFFTLVEGRLTPAGLLALNLIGSARAPDVAAVRRTVASVFENSLLLAPQDEALAPLTLLAARGSVEDESTIYRLQAAGLSMPRRADLDAAEAVSAPVLTDDLNPIALLRRPTARAWRLAARPGYEAARGTGDPP